MAEAQHLVISFAGPLQIVEVDEPPSGVLITLTFGSYSITAEGTRVMYTLPVDHSVKMQVSYVDAHGNPAVVDGDVSWQSSDESIISVEHDADDTTICTAVAKGGLGQAQITATADADLGNGTREIITVCDVAVVAGEAVAGTIQPVGEPEPPQVEPHA